MVLIKDVEGDNKEAYQTDVKQAAEDYAQAKQDYLKVKCATWSR